MHIKQIFEHDYPENKNEIIQYSSDYYYKLKRIKKLNNYGETFNWDKIPFEKLFIKKWEGVLFESYKTNAEYYILVNNDETEIGIAVFEFIEHSKRTRIWDIMIHPKFQRRGFGMYLMEFAEKIDPIEFRSEMGKNIND